ncbi:MAG TPA: FtsQ-type POTRA domain-containing protein [Candidatus Dormibacteraeota bacterium]|nr:FtsQ-type POTRA domain-containing protein [Candidatus Dormibacteraeota bacterium]
MKRLRPATGSIDATRAGADTEPLRILRRDRSGALRKRRRGLGGAVLTALVLGTALLGGSAYGARHYLTHSQRFRLRRIEFSETRYAPEGELRRSLSRAMGRNLFRLDPARLGRDLEARRWVKRAVVKRVLPDGIFCAIEERAPGGLALLRDRVWLVDDEGVAIDPFGGQTKDYSWPILVGLDDRNAARARAQMQRGVRLVAWLQENQRDLAKNISEIDLSRDDRLELRLNQGGPSVRLNPSDFGANLDRYLTLRDYLATDFGDGAYVDLRFRDRIAFRPRVAVKGD